MMKIQTSDCLMEAETWLAHDNKYGDVNLLKNKGSSVQAM